MRRKEREVTDRAKIIEIIESCDVCHLGLVDDFGAYILPMNFGFEDNGGLTLYFHCAGEGKKLDLLRKDSRASFEMDSRHRLKTGERACAYSFLYSSVIGRGEVSFLEGGEKLHALDMIMSHYGVSVREYDKAAFEKVTALALKVTELSAKAHQ